MPLMQTDVDTIKRAIASGVRSVSFADGRRVEYQSVDEMKQALALAEADVAAAAGQRSMTSLASFSRE